MNSVDNILQAINLLSYEAQGKEERLVRVEDLQALADEIKSIRFDLSLQVKRTVKYRKEMNLALVAQLEMLEDRPMKLDVRI